jgi:hypothetical protein
MSSESIIGQVSALSEHGPRGNAKSPEEEL